MRRHRFLVVDDDPAVVHGLTQLLIDDGHFVAPFATGAAAVAALMHQRLRGM